MIKRALLINLCVQFPCEQHVKPYIYCFLSFDNSFGRFLVHICRRWSYIPLKIPLRRPIAVRRGLKSKCIPLDSKTNPHFTKVTSHGHLLLKKTKSVTSHINRCNLKDCNFVIWQLKTRSRFECWFQEDGGNFLIEGINNFQRYLVAQMIDPEMGNNFC